MPTLPHWNYFLHFACAETEAWFQPGSGIWVPRAYRVGGAGGLDVWVEASSQSVRGSQGLIMCWGHSP